MSTAAFQASLIMKAFYVCVMFHDVDLSSLLKDC
jgi:hypothetical protein